MNNKLHLLGYASSIGVNNPGSELGPLVLQKSQFLNQFNPKLIWEDIIAPTKNCHGLKAIPIIAELSEKIAQYTQQFTSKHYPLLVVGGDHSSAIGTWSGTATALMSLGPLGLIWIDAHMDSHTPLTTHTGNVHGMPLACLLGFGDPLLTQVSAPNPKILPTNLCLVGIRSYEPEEQALLESLNVRIFYMDEINQRGLINVLKEAKEIVTKNTAGYGISIDLDAIDPDDAPGVTTAASNGINGKDFCQSLSIFNNDPRLLGLEIAEFNPKFDREHKTEILIKDIIAAIYEQHH